MAKLEKSGIITITYTADSSSAEIDEETLAFWLFKVMRQFGIKGEVETDSGDTFTEEVLDRNL